MLPASEELAWRLCAVRAVRAADARVKTLAATVDYGELEATLTRFRLLGLVGSRLLEAAPRAVPQDFRQRVAAVRTDGGRHATLMAHRVEELCGALEQLEIGVVPLKGVSLAERAYEDPGLRTPPTDVDLLVRPERLDSAVEVMRGVGYELFDEVLWKDGLPHYHFGMTPTKPGYPRLELHWRVHWYESELTARMLERRVSDGGVARLATIDELATMILIYARDGFVGLRLAADIAALWDAEGHTVPPGALDPMLEEHPQLRGALLAGLGVLEELVGLPRERLAGPQWRTGPRARLSMRLGDWRTRASHRQAATNITLIDLLLTPRGAYRTFARHYFLQPVAKYTRDYGWRPEHRVRNRLRRLVRAGGRAGRSLGQYLGRLWWLRGGRAWTPIPARTPVSVLRKSEVSGAVSFQGECISQRTAEPPRSGTAG